jgi:uncharacterized protein YaiE (UPF0345 family)
MDEKELEQAKKIQEYFKTRGFVIPPNGKFTINVCNCKDLLCKN